ncbi:MAG: alpha/beta fold hydrolase [Spongiibacteraceae bacterium]
MKGKQKLIHTEYVQANGLNFEVDMAGDGDKLAICLHGFPENSYSWRYQLPMLAKLGYTAWAPNLRGYKGTTRPKGARNYVMDILVEDVRALIAASGKKDVTLIAHDWGGAIAWAYVLQKAGPIDKFIVMNLPHPKLMKARLLGLTQLLRSWYIFFFQIPWLPEFLLRLANASAIGKAFSSMAVDKSMFPPETLEHFTKPAMQAGALTAMLNYYRGLIRHGLSQKVYKALGNQVSTPTLMIWGEQDTALDITTTHGTSELVDDLTLRYLPNVSHWVQQEAPEVVNTMMEAWLTGKPVPMALDIAPSLATKE